MLRIANSISFCLDDEHGHRRAPPSGIIVHRFGVPGVHDAAGVARFDRSLSAVGRMMAYSYVISSDGLIEQALPDWRWGWHCRGWSNIMIGIALIGDFRVRLPTADAGFALLRLCRQLCAEHAIPVDRVQGHSEIPGGSAYPDHQCPGSLLSLEKLRTGLEATMEVI